MRSTEDAALSRGEQQMIEGLWAASVRVHEEDRRREVCNLWIDHHEHPSEVFFGHANHHARYQSILAKETEEA